MLYHFTWNSQTLVKQQVKAWKDVFIKKYGDFNLVHIKDIHDIEKINLAESLTAMSFLAEKKLIIIDYKAKEKKNKDEEDEKQSIEDYIITILDKIPDENIVLFNSINPDKRSKLYKELAKKAEVKEFNLWDEMDLKSIIQKKYLDRISNNAINRIIKYKSSNLEKIISELEKLFITYDFLDEKEILEHIYPELEESIFLFIDDLLNLNLRECFKKLDIILENTNIYLFYNSLLSNLRVQVFISKLKDLKLSQKEIWDILKLWNRTFLINKSYRINNSKLENFYINLVDLDKKMKSWNMIWSDDLDIKFELENVILSLK